MPAKKTNTEKGHDAEKIAAEWFTKSGWQVLAQNYRHRRGEIDLVLVPPEGNVLVFVEVKSRASATFGYPEEAVTASKAALVRETACRFIEERDWHGDIRFDILSITGSEILHLPDAF